jgi:aromatic amino acid aminotransferase I / 2-aminoadipate transaminase
MKETWIWLPVSNIVCAPRPHGFNNLTNDCNTGMATGLPQLIKVQREIVEKIYQPAYSNWATLVHTGNTDGWSKIVNTFLNPGDNILVSEWTYPTALSVRRILFNLLCC